LPFLFPFPTSSPPLSPSRYLLAYLQDEYGDLGAVGGR